MEEPIWNISKSADDLNYLFGGGYLRLEMKLKSYLAHVESFYVGTDGHTKANLTVIHDKSFKRTAKRVGTDAKIFTFSPTLGIVNSDLTVCYLERMAARQYTRVITDNTLSISPLLGAMYKILNIGTQNIVTAAKVGMLTKNNLTRDEALGQVLSGEYIARAINNKYFFANTLNYKDVVLGYKKNIVGTYNEATNRVELFKEFNDLEEEVSNYVNL